MWENQMDLDIIARMIIWKYVTLDYDDCDDSIFRSPHCVMMPKKYLEKGAETPTKLGT